MIMSSTSDSFVTFDILLTPLDLVIITSFSSTCTSTSSSTSARFIVVTPELKYSSSLLDLKKVLIGFVF
jgi:hypothetical protein